MSNDPIQEALSARRPPRLSHHFATRVIRHIPPPSREVTARSKVLAGVALLAVFLLLAVIDWPAWLSTTAVILAPLAALAMLAPGRIAAGIAAVVVFLLREPL